MTPPPRPGDKKKGRRSDRRPSWINALAWRLLRRLGPDVGVVDADARRQQAADRDQAGLHAATLEVGVQPVQVAVLRIGAAARAVDRERDVLVVTAVPAGHAAAG